MPVNWLSATTRAVRPARVVGTLKVPSTTLVRYPGTNDNVSARKAAFSGKSYSTTTTATKVASNRSVGPSQITIKDVRNAHSQALLKFSELLTLSNQRSISGSQELADIQGALEIYNELKDLKLFYPSDVAKLVQSIHASSRMTSAAAMRGKVISEQKKKLMQDQIWLLLNCVEVVGQDILDGRVKINAFGMMQFFSCYATMKDPSRGLHWMNLFKESDNKDLVNLVKQPKVAGAIVELLIANGSPLEDIETVYKECQGASDINLEHTMCRAYLYFGKTTDALKLFNNIISEYNGSAEYDSYFARVHDSFIGDCQDLTIAKAFFQEAVNGSTPYACTIHPSSVHRLIERCWKSNKDFSEILKLWGEYLAVVSNRRERSYNIVTYSLMVHFMEKYPEPNEISYAKLKEIITIYLKNMPSMGMLFLNTVLTNVSKWKSSQVNEEIIASYDVYGVEKGFDTIRVILNSLQGVSGINLPYIQRLWNERLALSAPLQVYDFFALAKACERPSEPEFINFFVQEVTNFFASGALSQGQMERFKSGLFRYIQVPVHKLDAIRTALKLDVVENNFSSGSN